MSVLTPGEQEPLSLGAAMGSKCVSCIEHHIPASRKAGLTGAQISEAIQVADNVRRVAARKTLNAALELLSQSTPANQAHKPCCG